MKTHLITVTGVLRKTVGGAVIPEGSELYRGLAAVGAVIPVMPAHQTDTSEETAQWLELHGMIHHPFISQRGPLAASELRLQGYDIGLIVVADPAEALYHIRAGFTVLLFTHAQYALPSWRPDSVQGIRPWASIVDEASNLAAMRAQDARLKEVD